MNDSELKEEDQVDIAVHLVMIPSLTINGWYVMISWNLKGLDVGYDRRSVSRS
jgi:hypothetical protein